MGLDRHVWEGWTPQHFIDELSLQVKWIQEGSCALHKPFKNKAELKAWCKDNQPYYKKHIPEVVTYFAKKYGIK